jgi:two-component system, NtrC family, sensor kinase
MVKPPNNLPASGNGVSDAPLGAVSAYSGIDGPDPATLVPDGSSRQPREDSRPKISIRLRLILAFFLIFALCAGISVWIIYSQAAVQHKIRFLEIADGYMREIQQVRRYEKNYLLYETNLQDAVSHLHQAQKTILDNHDHLTKVIAQEHVDTILHGTQAYEQLLGQIAAPGSVEQADAIESRLRRQGAQMIALATDFAERERQAVDRTFSQVKKVTSAFLGVLMIIMILIALFINREILKSLIRFQGYTDRIAAGDFTRIRPARKFQDEFTQLAMAVNHMIDELEKRQKILVESHKMRAIGNLVAGVAHELNNPLNNILLTVASLQEDYDAYPETEKMEMIGDVISETDRAQKIVRNLLDFARESETRIRRLDVKRTLEKAISLVSNQVRIAKIRLETFIPDDLPPVHGDDQLLNQVFVNLILNAVDVLPEEQGRISISIDKARRDGYLAMNISDNGPGMPEHICKRIFEPFFTTKAEGKGTGLGLSVSRGIIQQLGGFIEVESVVGTGTTFSVFLPTTHIPFKPGSGRKTSEPQENSRNAARNVV